MSVIGIIRIILTICTIPVYCVILATLIKYKSSHFPSSFFTLYISTGCADLFYVLSLRVIFEYIPTFIVGWEIYSKSILLATLHRMAMFGIYYVQIVGIIAISVNRLTAIAFPTKHEEFWSKKATVAVLLIQWIILFPWAIPMIFPCCQSIYYEGAALPDFIEERAGIYYSAFDALLGTCAVTVLLATINFATVLTLRKYNKTHSNPGSQNDSASILRRRNELRLTFVGLVLSITSILSNLANVFYYFRVYNIPYNTDVITHGLIDNWYNCFSDAFTLSSPYLLLLTSSGVRLQIKSLFTFVTPSVTSGTTITSSTPRRGNFM